MNKYRLAEGVTLIENEGFTGGTLARRYPKRLIKLSKTGISVLRSLCNQEAGPILWDERVLAFAEKLENDGFLQRCFAGQPVNQMPTVSIIVPTYNREKLLKLCLESLISLDYPKDKLEMGGSRLDQLH